MSNVSLKAISNPIAVSKIFWYSIRVFSNDAEFLGWALLARTLTKLDVKRK